MKEVYLARMKLALKIVFSPLVTMERSRIRLAKHVLAGSLVGLSIYSNWKMNSKIAVVSTSNVAWTLEIKNPTIDYSSGGVEA